MATESEVRPHLQKELSLLALHKFPEFLEECKNILDQEWPRSSKLRYRTLNASCDSLPTSLALVHYQANGEPPEVLGYSRILIFPDEDKAVWIECVVIRPHLRGKDYGRIIMTKTECFASSLGFKVARLGTHNQKEFYKKIGYTFCTPDSPDEEVYAEDELPTSFMRKSLLHCC